MAWIDIISIFASGVSLLSAAASWVKSNDAKKAKLEASELVKKANRFAMAERLNILQPHIRNIAPVKYTERGRNFKTASEQIETTIGEALSSLSMNELEGRVRKKLQEAQSKLFEYNSKLPGYACENNRQNIQYLLQNAISELRTQEDEGD